MSRRLLILRHGQAESDSPEGDRGRPLSPRGRSEVARVGAYLKEQGLMPDLALVSAATRTRQTWQVLCAGWGTSPDAQIEPDLYLAEAATALECLRLAPPHCRSLMLVGHNPGLSDLCVQLARPESVDGMVTAGLVIFDVSEDWSALASVTARFRLQLTPDGLGRPS